MRPKIFFRPKMNFKKDDLWREKTELLNWQGPRFYFNWSLTLEIKSCFFYNLVFKCSIIFARLKISFKMLFISRNKRLYITFDRYFDSSCTKDQNYYFNSLVFLGKNWFLLKKNCYAQVPEEFLFKGKMLLWKESILFWKKLILLIRNYHAQFLAVILLVGSFNFRKNLFCSRI